MNFSCNTTLTGLLQLYSMGGAMYDRYLGRVQLMDSLGLVISSVLGAFIAAHTSLRLVYFVSIPFVLLSIIALAKFKEPVLHKQHSVITLPQQLKDTFRAVTRSRAIFSIVIVLILRSAIIFCIYEFAQLWLCAWCHC
jgi:MFS family permease